MTMFKVFAAPPWTDLGPNLLIVSIVLLLVGFWSIGIATSDEILKEYTSCGYNQAPLVLNGRWFDRTPCLDQKTDGLPGWHPFVGMVLSLSLSLSISLSPSLDLSRSLSRACARSLAPPLPHSLPISPSRFRYPSPACLSPHSRHTQGTLKAHTHLTMCVRVYVGVVCLCGSHSLPPSLPPCLSLPPSLPVSLSLSPSLSLAPGALLQLVLRGWRSLVFHGVAHVRLTHTRTQTHTDTGVLLCWASLMYVRRRIYIYIYYIYI
jgi:hypothetical protein